MLEASHVGPISSVDISPDGFRVGIGSHSGSIGMLDLGTSEHRTLMRSHTDQLVNFAVDSNNSEVTTTSKDGSIRVRLDCTQL